MSNTPRAREIRALLDRKDREGLTYRQLAREAGLKPSTLAGWAWRIRRQSAKAMTGAKTGFVEVSLGDGIADTRIELVLRSGRRILFPSSCDPSALARIVEAVEPC